MRKFIFAGARRVLLRLAAPALFVATLAAPVMRAQTPRAPVQLGSDSTALDALLARALATNPTIVAAHYRVDAARARIGPAGARPDPVLVAGFENEPLVHESASLAPGGRDPMTMHVVGVSQTIPYPGKLALRTGAARRDADAASAVLSDARLGIARDIRLAYYEIAYIDAAAGVLEKSRSTLLDVVQVADAHYAAGSGTEQDVLDAQLDVAQLAQQANALAEQRRTQLAALNALLGRASNAPIDRVAIPIRIARAAVADSAAQVRFTASTFGAAAADSPLPPLMTLQEWAIAGSPMLHEHEARIAAQSARVAIAERATRPDVDVSVQYGQRAGLPDMVSATLSLPLPFQHRQNQDQTAAAARDDLAALEAEHNATVNELRGQIAKLYADLERERTQLALDVTAILPQGRAAIAAATADYQAGKSDLASVLKDQSALFAYETSYSRSLSDFAETLAELDYAVGKEVLP